MAHTLTIKGWAQSGSYNLPKINGIEKLDSDSPITLKSGDIIEVPTDRASVTINGTAYTSQAITLNLADQDIALVASGPERTLETYHYVIINYAEKKSVDLTTLSGWANLAPGNHTIKIVTKGTGYRDSEKSAGVTVSKAASTVTLEKGTYIFKEQPALVPPINIDQAITGTINTLTANNTYGSKKTIDIISIARGGTFEPGSITIANNVQGYFIQMDNYEWFYIDENGEKFTATDTTKLRTIIFETDQQVSPEFYKWAITDGNLVKYEETYLLNTTLSMPSTATYYGLEGGYKIGDSIYDSICIGYNNGKELRIAWRDDSGDLMWDTLYNSNGWLSQSNRGLTLLKEPASAFLRWLQANSTQPV